LSGFAKILFFELNSSSALAILNMAITALPPGFRAPLGIGAPLQAEAGRATTAIEMQTYWKGATFSM
jgi:hypothetical protein